MFSALASQPWGLEFPFWQTPPFTPDQTCQRDTGQTGLSSLSPCLWTAYEAVDRSNVAEMHLSQLFSITDAILVSLRNASLVSA